MCFLAVSGIFIGRYVGLTTEVLSGPDGADDLGSTEVAPYKSVLPSTPEA
jgi:hypothetical protein